VAESPLVSVVIATHDMGRFLGTAVDSVLGQDYASLEVIVVDDGSTDDTPRVLEAYAGDPRVKVIRQERLGQTATKNRGLREARGTYIGFCDADDAWLPDKLSRQVPAFDAAGRIAVVYGDIICVDENEQVVPIPSMRRHSGRITRELLIDNFVAWPTVLVRRDVLLEMGGFDESLTMAIDYDLWLRISVKYEFFCLGAPPLARYRIWSGQMSSRKEERLDNSFRLLARFFAGRPANVSEADVARAYAHIHVTRARYRAADGRWASAWGDLWHAFRWRPYDRRLWRNAARIAIRRAEP
jgi:glycosyltransferase involved in cell wall biosynthesis